MYLSEVGSWTSQRSIRGPLRGSLFSTYQRSVLLFLLEFFKVFDLSEVILADLSEVSFRPLKRSVFVPDVSRTRPGGAGRGNEDDNTDDDGNPNDKSNDNSNGNDNDIDCDNDNYTVRFQHFVYSQI